MIFCLDCKKDTNSFGSFVNGRLDGSVSRNPVPRNYSENLRESSSRRILTSKCGLCKLKNRKLKEVINQLTLLNFYFIEKFDCLKGFEQLQKEIVKNQIKNEELNWEIEKIELREKRVYKSNSQSVKEVGIQHDDYLDENFKKKITKSHIKILKKIENLPHIISAHLKDEKPPPSKSQVKRYSSEFGYVSIIEDSSKAYPGTFPLKNRPPCAIIRCTTFPIFLSSNCISSVFETICRI
ncbi:unnamed protein product [Moneuplotes crassus]|uniref:Uncharacterized protein n=1 Tax=Euplotes crassus TaxID=5936 RepID=A0AAD1U5P9_EUPCR|nr:unnamed protein product [Moneuplotes crassus]